MGGMPGMDMGEGSDDEEGDSDDEEESPIATENGTTAENKEESKEANGEPVSTTTAGEQVSAS